MNTVKMRINTIDIFSPLEMSKLCLIIETKIITVLNVCWGNTINGGEQRNMKGDKVSTIILTD